MIYQEHRTPLYDAADNGHISIIKKLIESGADVNGVERVSKIHIHLYSLTHRNHYDSL